MGWLQTLLQTIWASVIALGWVKAIIAIVIIGILTRVNKLLGLVAVILFLAYLAHWI
jgi:hypothetical protein